MESYKNLVHRCFKMASNLANRSRRAANLTYDWPYRQTVDDHFRKSPSRDGNPTKIPADYCCPGEERAARRYEGTTKSSCHRQGDTASDHELYKLPEEKTSDEGSITEVEANDNDHGDDRPPCHQCDSCPKKYENSSREYSSCTHGKAPASRRVNKTENFEHENVVEDSESGVLCQPSVSPNRNSRNYGSPVNVPQALVAMKKLERLKELQRRRDYSERFYSQEIRRLIGENFFVENTAIVNTPAKNRERAASPGARPSDAAENGEEQRTRGGGFTKNSEPYGMMTTITRFNCGCVEETTIPIYSSSIGHVKKCDSHRSQERPVSKLGTSGNPQELSYRTGENPVKLENLVNTCQPPRTRGKNSPDYGTYRNAANSGSRDLESWEDRKVQARNRRSPRHLSPIRSESPAGKFSDTSSN